ncbi:MAG TPA: ornithine carbamoyltransferase [Acidimicrobiia bacterium]|nr:ornithine carbamoyltransferase [Acidimicrobiia bacterium]
MTRHLLSSDDLTGAEQAALVARAGELKKSRRDHPRSLEGRSVAMVFEKPSTRTRVSFEVAVAELGAHAVVLKTDEIQLGRGETVADTARVLSRFVDAVVIRTFGQEPLRELAKASSVPVVNALSDFEHPCQALADVMTIGERFGDLASVRLCYLGDGNNNVCHSLLLAGAKAGLARIEVAAPWGYQPDPGILQRAREIGESTGTEVAVSGDPAAAAADADVLYTDVWVSMGQDADRDERLAAFRGFGLTAQRLARAAPGAIAMHCLPAHRGEEIDAEVIDGPASAVWDQAENRLHTAKALLEWLLAGAAGGGAGR